MDRLRLEASAMTGLMYLHHRCHVDERGAFNRVFCAETLLAAGMPATIAQINHSITQRRGTVRGLHWQMPPNIERKIICCLRGKVFDVVVDLRRDAGTFLQWQAIELSAETPLSLVVPAGFAHGFQALTDDAEMLYLHDQNYHAASSSGLRFDDPRLAISWPLPLTVISERDRTWPLLATDFAGCC